MKAPESRRTHDVRYEERYVPGQQVYLSEVDPEQHADVIVINDDVAFPSMNERHDRPGR
jgi:hypothetical protein